MQFSLFSEGICDLTYRCRSTKTKQRKVCRQWLDTQEQSKSQQEQRAGSGLSRAFHTCRMSKHLRLSDLGLLSQTSGKRGAAWRGEAKEMLFTVTVKLVKTMQLRQASPQRKQSWKRPRSAPTLETFLPNADPVTHTSLSAKWHWGRGRRGPHQSQLKPHKGQFLNSKLCLWSFALTVSKQRAGHLGGTVCTRSVL